MERFWDDFVRDLDALVAIQSVADRENGAPGAPYGAHCAEALDFVLGRAAELGFAVKNVGGYAGHAEYGQGEDYCAVVTHLDVVPAGLHWVSPPFTLTERGGALYGRGTADDKGAALASLYCLQALKDSGFTGKRRMRLIFGCGEECGMDDLAHYFQREPLPTFAFTPDSDYPICNREKGILQCKCGGPTEESCAVTSFCAGAAVNAVPDYAQAHVSCTPEEAEKLRGAAARSDVRCDMKTSDEGLCLTVYGRGSHAMCPEEGVNAASHLIQLLHGVLGERAGKTLCMLHALIGLETTGASMGIACEDEPSGALTLSLGTVTVSRRYAGFSLDIRYPVTADGEVIQSKLCAHAAAWGKDLSIIHHLPPVYLPADHPLIGLLGGAYLSVTGEPAVPYATGGGTYARALAGRGVAFGPFFPHQPDAAMHKPDEHIDIEAFKAHMKICLEAMKRMMAADAPSVGGTRA